MNSNRFWVWLSSSVVLLHCAGGDELTVEESRQRVRDRGNYCCTHDGVPASNGCDHRAGVVYLEDFSLVDAAGRGDACGWIWDGR